VTSIAEPDTVLGHPIDGKLIVACGCRHYNLAMRLECSEEFGSKGFKWQSAHENGESVIRAGLNNV